MGVISNNINAHAHDHKLADSHFAVKSNPKCAYGIRGFHVTAIHVDIQFKSIKDRGNLNLITNVVSRGEHVPDIE